MNETEFKTRIVKAAKCGIITQEQAEAILPELKESEDERIRNFLAELVKAHTISPMREKLLAWLEKQGSQNLANSEKTCKDEQKSVHIDYISGIRKELLSIEDNAKNINGLTESQWVAIRAAHRLLGEYIAIEQNPAWSEEEEEMLRRCISATFDHGYLKECDWLKSLKNLVQPQPKPEWSKDDEERLNEVIETLNIVQANRRHTSRTHYSEDAIKKDIEWLKSRRIGARPQPKSEWGEEDEKKFIQAYAFIENTKLKDVDDIKASLFAWLKSLKSRVQPQPKSEWSEDDEQMVEDLVEAIDTQYAVTDYNEMVAWLKSLKDRYTWRPSDEQIEAVRIAAEIGTANNSWAMGVLKRMYQGFKKLSEK